MPATPTYVLLNQVTLAAASSSITFSSIPQNYADLVVVVTGTSTSGTNWRVRFNGDSGGNYSFVALSGVGSGSGVSGAYSGEVFGTYIWQAYAGTTSLTNSVLQIMEYSAMDKHKTFLARTSSPGFATESFANRWANTAPISSMEFFPQNHSWTTGTKISLYGLVA